MVRQKWCFLSPEPLYNEPLRNDVFGITKIFLTPVIVKHTKKNLDIKKPRYTEQIKPFPWIFVVSRFY